MSSYGSSSRSSSYSSQRSNIRTYPNGVAKCGCDQVPQVRTAWTKKNPGRKFIGCVNRNIPGGCDAFDWIEDEVCDKGMQIGRTLLTRLDEKEEKLKAIQAVNDTLKVNNKKMHEVIQKLTTSNNALLTKKQSDDVQIHALQNELYKYKSIGWILKFVFIVVCATWMYKVTKKY
ncbi:hypothetical protein BUALT_Bualt15G0126400 [Buddleja alternifolia]|uniref:Zinc finger GRF-type domain-containing protein n=1 Tax=Buddleja alternifolia TaxID=168488 RepID=A0AAV6WJY5_9LAMI|nr:hypothetical protein BUALT_Bualt15G0126400 [Buddleja alternifolia]